MFDLRLPISIHAPARGATSTSPFLINVERYFNPRSREGSDVGTAVVLIKEHWISIHAPARGATAKYQ